MSRAKVDERFVTSGSLDLVVVKKPSAHITRVYSSLIGLPFSSTIARRSPSGSVAIPRSAPFNLTASLSLIKFFARGSAPLLKSPLGSQNKRYTVQPKASSISGRAQDAAPFTASTTTEKFLSCIDFELIIDRFKV